MDDCAGRSQRRAPDRTITPNTNRTMTAMIARKWSEPNCTTFRTAGPMIARAEFALNVTYSASACVIGNMITVRALVS
jgi:hypothetical protein